MWKWEEIQELLREERLNSESHRNFIKWKFVKQVRFVNKNIKMRTRNAENKEM